MVGGWAVDLFIGQPTREHDDVDIGLARPDQVAARRLLPGWRYEKVVPRGQELKREPWLEEEWLELPVHEIHAHSPTGGHVEFLLLERRGTSGSIAGTRGSRSPGTCSASNRGWESRSSRPR